MIINFCAEFYKFLLLTLPNGAFNLRFTVDFAHARQSSIL